MFQILQAQANGPGQSVLRGFVMQVRLDYGKKLQGLVMLKGCHSKRNIRAFENYVALAIFL